MKKCALNHVSFKSYVVQISSDSAEDDAFYKRKEKVFFVTENALLFNFTEHSSLALVMSLVTKHAKKHQVIAAMVGLLNEYHQRLPLCLLSYRYFHY